MGKNLSTSDWLTPTQLARKWGISRQMVDKYLREGRFDGKEYADYEKIVTIKVGNKVIVRLFHPEYVDLKPEPGQPGPKKKVLTKVKSKASVRPTRKRKKVSG